MTIEPNHLSPDPERMLPPAGNGSLGGHDELPVAVPSAIFAARYSDPHVGTRRPGRPVPLAPVPDLPAVDEAGARAMVEAGPFDGLADLDAFERRLASLPAVAASRLLHFADGRAGFEISLASEDAPLQRQVRERLPDALVSVTTTGLQIDLGAID